MTQAPLQTQYCPHCGGMLAYFQQYNAWFCNRCRIYVNPQMPYISQPPVATPTEDFARARIFHAFRQRGDSDRRISAMWVPSLFTIQIAQIIVTFIALFYLMDDINTFPSTFDFNISDETMLLLIMAFLLLVVQAVVSAILIYWLVKRRDEHFKRDMLLRRGMMDYLISKGNARQKDLNVEIWTMNTIDSGAYSDERERSPGMWGVLIALMTLMPIIGLIILMYVLHFLTKGAVVHQDRQMGFNHQFQTAMAKMEEAPLTTGYWKPLPRRSTGLYIALTILTLGFFLPYWWYIAIGDMNDHFAFQQAFENELVARLQQGMQEGMRQGEE